MQKIVPHLWYDRDAVGAAELYCSAFDGSSITSRSRISGTPDGEVDILGISLSGFEMTLLKAGPYFKFNPSVSFLVTCPTKDEVDEMAGKLGVSGSELMPLGSYPFSERYAWIMDRYGLSWQLMYAGEKPALRRITPTQMFTGAQAGRAEEALRFYTGVFDNSAIQDITRYGPGEEPDAPGTVKHAGFTLEGEAFALMDSAYEHGFSFNEAVSYMVYCDTQEEIDRYWDALSAVPEAEQCGWLKDRFGFSWQIVPRAMGSLLSTGDKEKSDRVTKAMLGMKKLSIEGLRRAAL